MIQHLLTPGMLSREIESLCGDRRKVELRHSYLQDEVLMLVDGEQFAMFEADALALSLDEFSGRLLEDSFGNIFGKRSGWAYVGP